MPFSFTLIEGAKSLSDTPSKTAYFREASAAPKQRRRREFEIKYLISYKSKK